MSIPANPLLGKCVLFLAVDFVAWYLSFAKLYAIQAGRSPDIFASAEGVLACAGLFCGFDLARVLVGRRRWAFVLACGIVPLIARQLV